MKTVLLDHINREPFLGEGIRLEAYSLSPAKVVDKFLNADHCTSIVFLKNQLKSKKGPEGIHFLRKVQSGEQPVYGERSATLELNYGLRKGLFMQGIAKLFRSKSITPKSIGIVGFNKFEADEVMADFEFEGQSKRFYLNNSKKIRTYLEVTEDVKLVGGHPTLDSIIPKSSEYLRLIQQEGPINEER